VKSAFGAAPAPLTFRVAAIAVLMVGRLRRLTALPKSDECRLRSQRGAFRGALHNTALGRAAGLASRPAEHTAALLVSSVPRPDAADLVASVNLQPYATADRVVDQLLPCFATPGFWSAADAGADAAEAAAAAANLERLRAHLNGCELDMLTIHRLGMGLCRSRHTPVTPTEHARRSAAFIADGHRAQRGAIAALTAANAQLQAQLGAATADAAGKEELNHRYAKQVADLLAQQSEAAAMGAMIPPPFASLGGSMMGNSLRVGGGGEEAAAARAEAAQQAAQREQVERQYAALAEREAWLLQEHHGLQSEARRMQLQLQQRQDGGTALPSGRNSLRGGHGVAESSRASLAGSAAPFSAAPLSAASTPRPSQSAESPFFIASARPSLVASPRSAQSVRGSLQRPDHMLPQHLQQPSSNSSAMGRSSSPAGLVPSMSPTHHSMSPAMSATRQFGPQYAPQYVPQYVPHGGQQDGSQPPDAILELIHNMDERLTTTLHAHGQM
jgi:hypothetical protein